MSEAPFPQNPYAAPGVNTGAIAPPVRTGLPVYCIVIFIMDIVFSLIRSGLVAFGVIGMLIAPEVIDPELRKSALYEVLSGLAMVVFGLVGDIAMLLKQRWGLLFGWLKALAVCASLIVAVWQLHITTQQFPPGSPEQVGAYIGGAMMMVIRLSLLGLYIAALVVFARWSKQRLALGAVPPMRHW